MINCSKKIVLCSLIIFNFAYSQNSFQNKQYYKSFDSINNYQNIGVFNGLEYVDIYLSYKNTSHKFYQNEEFLVGNVIYDGQPYFDLKMKYDLLNDFLLLEYVNQKVNYLSLNTELISEFSIAGDKFVHLSQNEELEGFYRNGFFRELYKSNTYSLYVKYIKPKSEKFQDKRVFYDFSSKKVEVLYYQEKFYRLDNINDIIDILPGSKDKIQEFQKSNKKLYKKDREQFLQKLFITLEGINFNNVKQ
jgi:hypothetical protein